MALMLSRDRSPIHLEHSPDDIAIRFAGQDGRRLARRALANLKPERHRPSTKPRVHDRILLVHEKDASAAPIKAAMHLLSKAHANQASRTLPVYIEQSSGLRLVATDQLVVRFKARASAARRKALLADLGLVIEGRSDFAADQFLVAPVSVKSGSRALDLAASLNEADDVVEFAAPNFLSERRKTLNDPLFAKQWHLANPGGGGSRKGEDVHAVDAWTITPGGSPAIVIAIVDDGVDMKHPDLKPNIWTNPRKTAKDRHGRNFADPSAPYDPNPKAFAAPFDDTDINDIHGTCCAGIAAAAGNNGKGGAGVAYRCKILPVKIFLGADLAPNDKIADALRYAGLHADVISCSWSIPRHPDVEAAVDDVVRDGRRGKGSAMFFASGNDNKKRIDFPANHPKAFAVGATTDAGKRASYSNYGKGIDFVVPGGDDRGITTTDLSRRNRGYVLNGLYTDDFIGTSAATPLAAGVAALVVAVNPALTWDKVGDTLKATADKIDASGGRYVKGVSAKYGYGRLNAHAAVLAAKPGKKKKAARKR